MGIGFLCIFFSFSLSPLCIFFFWGRSCNFLIFKDAHSHTLRHCAHYYGENDTINNAGEVEAAKSCRGVQGWDGAAVRRDSHRAVVGSKEASRTQALISPWPWAHGAASSSSARAAPTRWGGEPGSGSSRLSSRGGGHGRRRPSSSSALGRR